MMTRARRDRWVFVDSSAHLALLDADDQHHQVAAAVLERLIDGRYRLFTTNTIVIEAHALILSTLGTARATGLLRDTDQSRLVIIRTRSADEARAKQLIYRYQDKQFSFTDAISFVVMERLGISLVFGFDRDFAQYGFTLLTSEIL